MRKGIAYSSRNFADIRTELVDFVKQYYPDILSDFNDASIGMLLIELNAAVSDMLSVNIDRAFQETQIDYAEQRNSILSMARTFGLKIPGKRPSISIVDFSVTVPVFGDSFDIRYAPIIRVGTQVSGSGKVFETVDDIDFSSPFTSGGIPNRLLIPNLDSNSNIISYTLTKREIVLNGITKVFTKTTSNAEVVPFYELVLPDNDILSITSVITKTGTNFSSDPTIDEFLDFDNRWFEVDALAEDTKFIEDTAAVSDNGGVKAGKWVRITRKFVKEYTDNGFMKLIFGSGNQDTTNLDDFNVDSSISGRIGDFINNLSLGETLRANSTVYIQYRVGGGSNTNLGSNTITSVNLVNMFVNGPDSTVNNSIRQSLSVNNPVPALGGRDEPSVDEIRQLTKYNFSAQNRAVTIKDYQSRVSLMPGEFGVPFRTGVFEEQNKIMVYILGLNSSGKLSNSSTNTLKQNISNYLADYKMLNDYVVIGDGRIINLGFEFDLLIEKDYPQSQIISNVIRNVKEFIDINKHYMGENIYLGELLENVNNVGGVTNVIEIRVFNKVGEGVYSMNEIEQPYVDDETREIEISDQYTLFGNPIGMFEVKFPEKDIKVRVKTAQ
jgi:hypothetical protein|tara:strand:+ start:831 stop:2657 length:1827 start_codon:yes stop_codon:yes gene_type:complete